MKRVVMAFMLLMVMATVAYAERWTGTKDDSVFVVRLLDGARTGKPQGSLALYFARKFIGRPYVAHTLEVADDHTVVVNTRQLDCTTLVENVTALTLCAQAGDYSFDAFVKMLRLLRYRDGHMDGYTSRLHYFTDWIENNSHGVQASSLRTKKGSGNQGVCAPSVSEKQSPNPPFSAVQTVKVGYMSAHPKAYKALREHPEYVEEIARSEKLLNGKRFRYIPKARVRNTKAMRSAVKDGDIIAITCSKPGLDIAHLGFAVWHKDGLHLLNASMIHHKVVDEQKTLYQYLKEHKSHIGIRIISINKNSKN